MIKHKIKNTDCVIGLSPDVFPDIIKTRQGLVAAVFTQHEICRAVARARKYGLKVKNKKMEFPS